jgi:hypothetical protein
MISVSIGDTDSNASSCTFMTLYTLPTVLYTFEFVHLIQDRDQDRDQDHNQAGFTSSFCPFDSGPGVGDLVSLSRGMWSWIFAINSDAAFWDPS